ncbi:hypothetical protein GGI13_007946, partial [Coemansia sp. RSA 455]
MPMRSRIPVRKAVPGVTDENKVGAVAGRMIKDGGEPVVAGSKLHPSAQAVSAIPSAAGVVGGPGAGVSKAFGVAAQRAAVPAKVFGSQVSRIAAAAAGVRPRSAFGEVANTKVVKGAVGKLTKPEEVAAMINGKQMVRGGRVALNGTGVGTVVGGGVVKQGLPLARSRLGTVTARPTGVAAAAASRSTTAILGNRPISKPSAAFGARRPVAVKSTAVSVVSAAGANAVAANASKRARSAAAPVVDAPSSVLGKHTRSGRLPVRASSVDSVETTSTLAMSSERSYQEAGAAYDSTAATSVETSPAVESTGFGDDKLDDDRKFVDMDAIDYALAHSGLLGE